MENTIGEIKATELNIRKITCVAKQKEFILSSA